MGANMLATEDVIHRFNGGRDIPLYIAEMGWPTYSGTGGISQQESAALPGPDVFARSHHEISPVVFGGTIFAMTAGMKPTKRMTLA